MSATAWVSLFGACHASGFAGPARLTWPDGRSTLRQPAVTVATFAVIAEEIAKEAKSNDGAG